MGADVVDDEESIRLVKDSKLTARGLHATTLADVQGTDFEKFNGLGHESDQLTEARASSAAAWE